MVRKIKISGEQIVRDLNDLFEHLKYVRTITDVKCQLEDTHSCWYGPTFVNGIDTHLIDFNNIYVDKDCKPHKIDKIETLKLGYYGYNMHNIEIDYVNKKIHFDITRLGDICAKNVELELDNIPLKSNSLEDFYMEIQDKKILDKSEKSNKN